MESRAKNSILIILAISLVLNVAMVMSVVMFRNKIFDREVIIPKVLQTATVLLASEDNAVLAHPLAENKATHNPSSSTSPGLFPGIIFGSQKSIVPPVRLKISAISVDASLESVGLTSEGTVDVPKVPANAAWFNRSPLPGEEGTSVIVGHFGWENGISAVFDDLAKLHEGDEVYVEDITGAVITFVVREVRTYDHTETVPDAFASDDGKSHLNLITCEGVWNKGEHNYSNRLVVFTDRKT